MPVRNMTLDEQDEISLPCWIGGTSLTLEEIGAITCFACHQSGCEVPEVSERIGTPEMAVAIGTLQKKGLLKATLNGNRVLLEIDLAAVMPPCFQNANCAAAGGEGRGHE